MNATVNGAAESEAGPVPGHAPASPPPNPFVGPVPLDVGQALYGRRRETEELSDLLVSKRIVLLFSPSGAGKSSLIRAGLIARLKDAYEMEALPIVRLGHRDPACDSDASINRYRLAMLHSLEKMGGEATGSPARDLRTCNLNRYFEERVSASIGHNSHGEPHYPLLIFDQFEELFTADPLDVDQKRGFLEELGSLLKGGEAAMAIWALFAIREDRLAELQPYLDLIPTALAFRYRLDALGVDAAREAIGRTAGSDWMDPDVPQRLVDDLCKVSVRGADGRETTQPGRFVEPVQLQVVCRGLWEKIVARQGRRIEAGDVQSQGHSEVDRALRDFFDEEVAVAASDAGVSERALRGWIERQLISASGVRVQTLRDLTLPGRTDDAIVRLVDAHLLRIDTHGGHDWIELPHDRLVAPIRAANEAWSREHLQPFQKQAAYWCQATGDHARHLLLAKEELATAEAYAHSHTEDVTREEFEYLDASRQEIERDARERKERTRRKVMMWSFAAVVLGLLVTWVFVERWQKIQAAERSAIYQEVGAARDLRSTADALNELLLAEPAAVAADKTGGLSRVVDNEIRHRLASLPAAVMGELQPRRHIVWSLAFSADGSRLLAGSWDGHISVQDVAPSGAVAQETKDLQSETYAVAAAGAGELVASTHGDGSARLWHLDGRELQQIAVLVPPANRGRRLTTADFSSDGRWLAVAGWNKSVEVWDLADPRAPEHVASFVIRGAPIMGITFLAGADEAGRQTLVTTDYDGIVRLWSVGDSMPEHPEPLRELSIRSHEGRNVGISTVAADPSGHYLVAGDTEGFVHLWDLASKDPLHDGVRLDRASHRGGLQDTGVKGIAFAPRSNEFISVGVDGYAMRWTLPANASDLADLAARITVQRFRIGERLYSVAYRPHQPGQVAVGGTRSIILLDLDRGPGPALSTPLPASTGQAEWQTVSMDEEGARIAARGKEGTIHIWLREHGSIRAMSEWALAEASASAFALSPDGQRLVTVDCHGWPTEWSLRIGARPQPVHAPPAGVAGDCLRHVSAMPSFSPDGRFLATAGDNTLRLWRRAPSMAGAWAESFPDRSLQSLVDNPGAANPDRLTAMAFSMDSRYLAVGSDSGDVRLWKLEAAPQAGQFASVADLDVGRERVSALTFDPDGKTLRVGGDDGILTKCAVPSLAIQDVDPRHDRSITGAIYVRPNSPGSRTVLVTADAGGYIVEWISRGNDATRAMELAGRGSSPVRAIALSRDGTFLVTAGDDLLAWNLAPANVLATAKDYVKRSYVKSKVSAEAAAK